MKEHMEKFLTRMQPDVMTHYPLVILKTELETVIPKLGQIPYPQIETLPYLAAVI